MQYLSIFFSEVCCVHHSYHHLCLHPSFMKCITSERVPPVPATSIKHHQGPLPLFPSTSTAHDTPLVSAADVRALVAWSSTIQQQSTGLIPCSPLPGPPMKDSAYSRAPRFSGRRRSVACTRNLLLLYVHEIPEQCTITPYIGRTVGITAHTCRAQKVEATCITSLPLPTRNGMWGHDEFYPPHSHFWLLGLVRFEFALAASIVPRPIYSMDVPLEKLRPHDVCRHFRA